MGCERKLSVASLKKSLDERFWEKVVKTEGGCWNWTASTRHKGYGAFVYEKNGVVVQGRAHRYSWELHCGDIPDGMFVLHRCDNPACVNPEHLFLGTNQDNVNDMMRKGRHGAGGSKCGSNGKWKRGKDHWNCRIPDDTVVLIKNDRSLGMSCGLLSKKYGVAISHVYKICTGKIRKEVGNGV